MFWRSLLLNRCFSVSIDSIIGRQTGELMSAFIQSSIWLLTRVLLMQYDHSTLSLGAVCAPIMLSSLTLTR